MQAIFGPPPPLEDAIGNRLEQEEILQLHQAPPASVFTGTTIPVPTPPTIPGMPTLPALTTPITLPGMPPITGS